MQCVIFFYDSWWLSPRVSSAFSSAYEIDEEQIWTDSKESFFLARALFRLILFSIADIIHALWTFIELLVQNGHCSRCHLSLVFVLGQFIPIDLFDRTQHRRFAKWMIDHRRVARIFLPIFYDVPFTIKRFVPKKVFFYRTNRGSSTRWIDFVWLSTRLLYLKMTFLLPSLMLMNRSHRSSIKQHR